MKKRFLTGLWSLFLLYAAAGAAFAQELMVGGQAVGIQISTDGVVVAGLALSLSVQTLLTNFFSGIMLLINKPFRDGDAQGAARRAGAESPGRPGRGREGAAHAGHHAARRDERDRHPDLL